MSGAGGSTHRHVLGDVTNISHHHPRNSFQNSSVQPASNNSFRSYNRTPNTSCVAHSSNSGPSVYCDGGAHRCNRCHYCQFLPPPQIQTFAVLNEPLSLQVQSNTPFDSNRISSTSNKRRRVGENATNHQAIGPPTAVRNPSSAPSTSNHDPEGSHQAKKTRTDGLNQGSDYSSHDFSEDLKSEYNESMKRCSEQDSIEPFDTLLQAVGNDPERKGWLKNIVIGKHADDNTPMLCYGMSYLVHLAKQLQHGRRGLLCHAWGGLKPKSLKKWIQRFKYAEDVLPTILQHKIDFHEEDNNPFLLYTNMREILQIKKMIDELKAEMIQTRDARVPISEFALFKKSEVTQLKSSKSKAKTTIENLQKEVAKQSEEIKILKDLLKKAKAAERNALKQAQQSQDQCSKLREIAVEHEETSLEHKQKSEKWDKMIKKLGARRYRRLADENEKANHFYAMCMAAMPAASRHAVEPALALAAAALLESLGLLEEMEDPTAVGRLTPSADCLGYIMHDFAALQHCFIILDMEENAEAVSLMLDKSQRGTTCNKVDHYAKIIAYWHKDLQRMVMYPFCMDGSKGTAEECANAVVHSLETKLLGRLPGDGKINCIIGDNGGGDSGGALCEQLEARGYMDKKCPLGLEDLPYQKTANCNHHNLDLASSNGISKYIGISGIGYQNAVNALSLNRFLQNSFGNLEFRYLVAMSIAHNVYGLSWKEIADNIDALKKAVDEVKKYGQATSSRWNSIAQAANRAFEEGDILKWVSEVILLTTTTDKSCNKIASQYLSVMREPVCNEDIKLLALLSKVLISFSYDEFKKVGEISKLSGFRSEQCLVLAYILHNNVTSLGNGKWKEDEEFGFKQYFESLEKNLTYEKFNEAYKETNPDQVEDFVTREQAAEILQQQYTKVNCIFAEAGRMLDKHCISGWVDDIKILCALLCGGRVTQMMADLLSCDKLEEPTEELDLDEIHRYHVKEDEYIDIRIGDLRDFVIETCSNLVRMRGHEFIKRLKGQLELVAKGGAATLKSPACSQLKDMLLHRFQSIGHTNQQCELVFKKATNIAKVHLRDEREKSEYLVPQGTIFTPASQNAWKESRAKTLAASNGEKEGKNRACHVRGVLYSQHIMKRWNEMLSAMTINPNFTDTLDELRAKMTKENKPDYQRDKRAAQETCDKMADHEAKGTLKPVLNAQARRWGHEVTRAIGGRIKFTSIQNKHINLLHEELVRRNLEPGRHFHYRNSVSELKEILQEKVGNGAKDFRPEYWKLLKACTELPESEWTGDMLDGEDDDDPLDARSDVFIRANVARQEAACIDDLVYAQTWNNATKNRLKAALKAELEARKIHIPSEKTNNFGYMKNLLKTSLNNRRRCFIPKSKEMSEVVLVDSDRRLIQCRYVDEDFHEQEDAEDYRANAATDDER